MNNGFDASDFLTSTTGRTVACARQCLIAAINAEMFHMYGFIRDNPVGMDPKINMAIGRAECPCSEYATYR